MHYDHKNVNLARNLRKNMTPWERKLWHCFLKAYPIRFQRQKPMGAYIADYYCAKAALVVELDGSGHYTKNIQIKDQKRTEEIEQNGIMVLRLSNLDVDKNFYGVCTVIDDTVKSRYAGD